MPVSDQDHPRTWSEFLDWFSSKEACLSYLERLRWPHGFACPNCACMAAPYRSSRTRLRCKDCGRQTTVTSGTILDKTRTPLKVWLTAAWYLTSQKQGVSAWGLQRVLGLGSYQTTWTRLHRFRRAMLRADRERLKGLVEVDETYLAITDFVCTASHEFVFRFNRRTSNSRGMLFYRLLQQAVVAKPVTYQAITRTTPDMVKPA